jgi:Mn-dependent DtxR family transcriptional regulator
MKKDFCTGVKICQKTGIRANDLLFLQYLLLSYPGGKVSVTLKEIAKELNVYSIATVFCHLRELERAGLVTITKKKHGKVYRINMELIERIINA